MWCLYSVGYIIGQVSMSVNMPREAIRSLIANSKVTIPKRIRDDYDLENGDEVFITVEPVDQ